MPAPGLILTLLLTSCFTLATWLQPHALTWNKARAQSDNLLALTLGDARRMFANHFFIKADVYFHSGYYPSIFNQARTNQTHIAEQADAGHAAEADEKEEDFLGPPQDWIDAFGRNFYNTKHTHLDDNGKVGEMLPWLRLSAELDPQQIETYTVGAYWLREKMHQPADAAQFLREGMRANPDSCELLFELGRLYRDSLKDNVRARNLWELADRKLLAQEKANGSFDLGLTRQILIQLAKLEEDAGQLPKAIHYLQRLHDALPPEFAKQQAELQTEIEGLQQKLAAPKNQ